MPPWLQQLQCRYVLFLVVVEQYVNTRPPHQFAVRSAFDMESTAVKYVASKWGVSTYQVWFDSASNTPTGAVASLKQETVRALRLVR